MEPEETPREDRSADEARRRRERDYNRGWAQRNPDKVADYRRRYLESHRQEHRDRERIRSAKKRKQEREAERRRVVARERYAADPATARAYQRERRIAQRAADPVGYREAKRQRNKRWWDRHRDEQNEKLREKHRANPEVKRAAAERYYAEHGDEVRARRRAYYWANREKQLEAQRRWRAREKRRIELGLPPRRLHRVSAPDRRANAAAAEEFFTRTRTSREINNMPRDPRTHPEDIARWERDCERARAAFAYAHSEEPVRPLARYGPREHKRSAAKEKRESAQAAEDARLDAIARAINDQLRTQPRSRTICSESTATEPIQEARPRGVSR